MTHALKSLIPAWKRKIDALSNSDHEKLDAETLLKAGDSSDDGSERTHVPENSLLAQQHHAKWIIRLQAILLCTSIILCFVLGFLFVPKEPTMAQCVEKTSLWSPANAAITYSEFDFENDFAHKTKYRGPPTPELERNWEELWWLNGVRFPGDKLHLINRTSNTVAGRTPRKATDGKGGYHAMIDVFHQLHCLNLLRQSTWQTYYATHAHIVRTPLPFTDSPVGIRMHLDHCIETLRLTLMCHADTTPSLLYEDKDSPLSVSMDFSAHRKCRNFWELREWTMENQIAPTGSMEWEPEE